MAGKTAPRRLAERRGSVERSGDELLPASTGWRHGADRRWTTVRAPPRTPRRSTAFSPAVLDARGEFLHEIEGLTILFQQARDLGDRVQDCCVVASSEAGANLGSELSVSSRARYIATWRGKTIACDRLSLRRSARDMWNHSQTAD